MKILARIEPTWPLRIGVGFMYLYSGHDLLTSPTAWHWALPFWLQQLIMTVMPIDVYLRIQGAVELLMAIVLLGWFMKSKLVKLVAILSTLEMAAILILALIPYSETNFLITFRDLGLLGGSLSLAAMLSQEKPVQEDSLQP